MSEDGDGRPNPDAAAEASHDRGPALPKENILELYKLIVEHARFEHTRWTENYRVFLTVAGAILAGEGVVLAAKRPSVMLLGFLLALALFGVVVACASINFIRRPDRSAIVWYWWLRDLEEGRPDLLLPIFTLGRRILSPQTGDQVAPVEPFFDT